jgi:hypothetical protein
LALDYFSQKAKKLNTIKPSYVIRAALNGNNEEVLDLVRKDQLYEKGVDASGQVIGTYSIATERINPQKKAGTHYTMDDTGFFTRSFELEITEEDISIFADGSTNKKEDIINKYGKEIIGFTEESVENYKGILQDLIPTIISDILTNVFKS